MLMMTILYFSMLLLQVIVSSLVCQEHISIAADSKHLQESYRSVRLEIQLDRMPNDLDIILIFLEK